MQTELPVLFYLDFRIQLLPSDQRNFLRGFPKIRWSSIEIRESSWSHVYTDVLHKSAHPLQIPIRRQANQQFVVFIFSNLKLVMVLSHSCTAVLGLLPLSQG